MTVDKEFARKTALALAMLMYITCIAFLCLASPSQ